MQVYVFYMQKCQNVQNLADEQELDGAGVIKLAGSGSLYLKQSTTPNKPSESEASSSSAAHSLPMLQHTVGKHSALTPLPLILKRSSLCTGRQKLLEIYE